MCMAHVCFMYVVVTLWESLFCIGRCYRLSLVVLTLYSSSVSLYDTTEKTVTNKHTIYQKEEEEERSKKGRGRNDPASG